MNYNATHRLKIGASGRREKKHNEQRA